MPSPEQQQQPIILVVDDEPLLLELASTYLETMGCRVLTAGTGRLALEILAQEPVKLILSDVSMTPVNGYELAEEVSRLYPSVRIQLMSGFEGNIPLENVDPELRAQLIPKPFRLDHLWERIEKILNEDAALLAQESERRSKTDRRGNNRRRLDRRNRVITVEFRRRIRDNRQIDRRTHSRRAAGCG